MKIIYSDNIPTDQSSETLWLDNIPDDCLVQMKRVCSKLNNNLGDRQGPYYKIVPDSHKLYKWEL